MSIRTEIDRLFYNVDNVKKAIVHKGVSVPQTANSDDLAPLIMKINMDIPETIMVVRFTKDSNGVLHSDYGYQDIHAKAVGSGKTLGEILLGVDVIGKQQYGYVFVICQTGDEPAEGLYDGLEAGGALVGFDENNNLATFAVSMQENGYKTALFQVDENGAVTTLSTWR